MKQGTTKNVTDIHGEVLYMENTGILREVHADGYGFKIMDLTVAAMLKAYLQQMVAETAVEQLGRVVSPAVRGLRGGTVKERKLAEKEWNAIDAGELAVLIDNARGKRQSAICGMTCSRHWMDRSTLTLCLWRWRNSSRTAG